MAGLLVLQQTFLFPGSPKSPSTSTLLKQWERHDVVPTATVNSESCVAPLARAERGA